MRAFVWRLFHAHNDEITGGRLGDNVCSREMAFLPTVWFLRELAVRIIDVYRNLCSIDLRSQPEPVFVAFEQLLPHSFLFSRTEIAAPIILAHLEALF